MKQTTSHNSNSRQTEPGQVIIIFAFTLIVLLLFVGLTVDVGRTFIRLVELRRATDAAVLAAAGQVREGRTYTELAAIATEVMKLNGVDPDTIVVENCATAVVPNDPALCVTPPRKLIRITSEATVPMAFMQLVGFDEIAISANAIGEAAAMDVVLVIDISESMAWDAAQGVAMRDPSQCNAADPGGADGFPGECQPFEEVKKAAAQFAARILNKSNTLEEDRLAIVTFANGWSSNADEGTHYRTAIITSTIAEWTSNLTDTLTIIRNLEVYEPGECIWGDTCSVRTTHGACRLYDRVCNDAAFPAYSIGDYIPDLYCMSCINPFGAGTSDYSTKTSTNIGGSLELAGIMYNLDTREDSLWVVVLLTDGMANATSMDSGDDIYDYSTYPIGFCPEDIHSPTVPFCQDEDVSTRHANTSSLYDADDYARDMADYVGCMPVGQAAACGSQQGQGAVIFTIGLGSGVLDATNEIHTPSRPYGASLLRYIAAVGYDGDPATDPCSTESDYTEWCGNYYYSPTGDQLVRVFEDIASRIFTRITH